MPGAWQLKDNRQGWGSRTCAAGLTPFANASMCPSPQGSAFGTGAQQELADGPAAVGEAAAKQVSC
jgi:hypothetical protein